MSRNVIIILLLAAAACLAWTCPDCGNVNQNNQSNCSNCGAQRPDYEEWMAAGGATAEPAVEAETYEVTGPRCPNCGRLVKEDWETCPYCNYTLIERPVEPLGRVAFSPRIGLLTDFDFFMMSFGASLGFNTAEREYIMLLFDVASHHEPGITAAFTELLVGYKQFFPPKAGSIMSAGAYLGLLMADVKEIGAFYTDTRTSAVFLISSRFGADFEFLPRQFFELELGLGYGLGKVSGFIVNAGVSLVLTF